MSERLPRVDNLCNNPENHQHHICELKSAGKLAEVKQLQQNARFVCQNCGAEAAEIGALCAPGPKGA